MNTKSWLLEKDPEILLELLRDRISLRKLRLFVCACWRRVIILQNEQSAAALQIAEQTAEQDAVESLENYDPYIDANSAISRFAWTAVFHYNGNENGSGLAYDLEREAQCILLRDIVSNPFASLAPSNSAIAHDVVQRAEEAYQDRSLPTGELNASRLALVADALEVAGNTDVELLAHFRSPGPHVRGCWATDLILGKS